MLIVSRNAKVKRSFYAAYNPTYGDHLDMPKVEDKIGKPPSLYVATKCINELYADVFARTYGFDTIELCYFNIFGPRQDPNDPVRCQKMGDAGRKLAERAFDARRIAAPHMAIYDKLLNLS